MIRNYIFLISTFLLYFFDFGIASKGEFTRRRYFSKKLNAFSGGKKLLHSDDNDVMLAVTSDIRFDDGVKFCRKLKHEAGKKHSIGAYHDTLLNLNDYIKKCKGISCDYISPEITSQRSNLPGTIFPFSFQALTHSLPLQDNKILRTTNSIHICASQMDLNDEYYTYYPCKNVSDKKTVSVRAADQLLTDINKLISLNAPVIMGGSLLYSEIESFEEGMHEYKTFIQLLKDNNVSFTHGTFLPYLGSFDFCSNNSFDVQQVNNCPRYLLKKLSHFLESEHLLSKNESERIHNCGFYSHDMGGASGIKFIFLNTFLYSWDISPLPDPQKEKDPCQQFKFLEDELLKSRKAGEGVIIVGNVPPTLNLSLVTGLNEDDVKDKANYMQSNYLNNLLKIFSSFSDVLVFQLYGYGNDFIHVLVDNSLGSPGITIPSSTGGGLRDSVGYLILKISNQVVSNIILRAGMRTTSGLEFRNFVYKLRNPMNPAILIKYTALDELFGLFDSIDKMKQKLYRIYYDSSAWKAFSDIQNAVARGQPGYHNIENASYTVRSRYVCAMLSLKPYDYRECIRLKLFLPNIEQSIGILCFTLSFISLVLILIAFIYALFSYKYIQSIKATTKVQNENFEIQLK